MKPDRRMDGRLLAAQVAIDNALHDPDMVALLDGYGYGQAELQAGRALYEEAVRLANRQKAQYGKQYRATQVVEAARRRCDVAYRRTLKMARVAFRGDGKARGALMLDGKRRHDLSGWLTQVATLYDNLANDADLMARMARFSFDEARLAEEKALLQEVVEANRVQEKKKGGAQEATKQRDAALAALDAWMADFKAIAQVALDERSQRLEDLGFGAVP